MIGIIVQLLLSWLIVWWVERNNLRVLGLMPSWSRVQSFVLHFVLTALCCASGFLLKMWLLHMQWHPNPAASWSIIGEGIWWNLKSVLFEELLFRGVLLYLFIKKLGTWKGILLSAAAFGIYHWFSQGSWGQPVPMLITFLLTGTMGIVLALTYAKTGSLYIAIAIHLGWNLVQSVVFSNTVIGSQWLITSQEQPQSSLMIWLTIQLVPVASAWLLNLLLLRFCMRNIGYSEQAVVLQQSYNK